MITVPTVLVCDDEPTVGAALRRALEPHAVEVLIDTSSDALHLAQHFQPQAILLDLLQWRDGLAMLKELKADPSTREIPVLLMSGLFTEADAPEVVCPGALALGALAVLPKPLPEPFVDSLARFVKLGGGAISGTCGAANLDFEIEVDLELASTS